ncbi:hypothetical protein A5791_16185 [Mycobacterium sp. 852002-51163_SCH5372311]|uniref:hypothetical protein n=1 Tax=Mycobacterium sp. 852002-51163_SCH5372311 TaxID=1834097 RepID=UPI0007FCA8DC|nr:hypothetical protein [Mycobacterium sp. 852002-51163_SCH5372311]OBF90874.1 hypothetical protein A5791_16185 [Mycobacterium sp. 852002-51163_SCH5372311]
MVLMLRNKALAVAACATLALNGCGGDHPGGSGPLNAIVSSVIPAAVQETPNPLRGQYEDLLVPLFPQGNPAQQRYPAWPASNDASMRVSWRQLQPTDPRSLPPNAPDDVKYDFSVIDDALAKLAARNMRLTLRVYAYNSCCDAVYPNDTNIEIPDWVRALPGASTSYAGPPAGSSAHGLTQVVPNWNDPGYLDGFEQLLAALGRRYDNDERLSVFEFSGYGDFSEDHIAYLRDALNAPGPAPDESVAALGYYSQFRDQNITVAAIRRLVAANVNAFPHTQLVVTVANPEIVRQVLADDVTKKLSAPVGVRSDALGVYAPLPVWAEDSASHYVQSMDPLVAALKKRLAEAPVITEWGGAPPTKTEPKAYYVKGLRDVVKYHVSMTSSVNFLDANSTTAMDPQLYLLWAQANVAAGYRYSVEARAGSQTLRDGTARIAVTWTNYGAAAATEKWVPGYRLVDFSGAVIRTLPAAVALKTLVNTSDNSGDQPVPASSTESVAVSLAGLAPGRYRLQASVAWQQHKPQGSHVVNYPPMQLARDGRDDAGWYSIATLDVPRDALTSAPQR